VVAAVRERLNCPAGEGDFPFGEVDAGGVGVGRLPAVGDLALSGGEDGGGAADGLGAAERLHPVGDGGAGDVDRVAVGVLEGANVGRPGVALFHIEIRLGHQGT